LKHSLKKHAAAEIIARLQKLRAGRGATPGKGVTVAEAASKYLAWLAAYRTAGELIKVRGMFKCVLGLYENEQAAAIGPAELRAIRRVMVNKEWSRTYVNDQIARVKRWYKWLAAEPLIPVDVYQTLEIVPGLRRGEDGARETVAVPPVADAVIGATLPYLPELVADMVRLQRLTGMRPAELCMLRPRDIDRSAAHQGVWLYRPASHKTQHHRKERVIFIGPQAQELLLRYLARDSEAYCFQPRDSEEKRRAAAHATRKTLLSCGNGPGTNRKDHPARQPGDRYGVATYRRAIHRACDKASVYCWSPNQLRHTVATGIRRKFGLEAAQVILGHAKTDVTQVYAERDLAKGAEVARRIG
jgi:integrase